MPYYLEEAAGRQLADICRTYNTDILPPITSKNWQRQKWVAFGRNGWQADVRCKRSLETTT